MELRYKRICRAIGSTLWVIEPERLADIMDVMTFKANGGSLAPDEIRAYVGNKVAAVPVVQPASSGVAVLSVKGIISHRIERVDDISGPGGTSVERFTHRFREALSNEAIGRIVIDIDSPGGSVDGIPELAAEILAARETKPIIAVANTLAASGAFWIASAASEISVTPSGDVGSIGVFAAHSDMSKRLEAEGEAVTLIHAGKFKVEGNPFQPLTDEARADMQSRINTIYDAFVKAVAKGRGVTPATVKSEFGEGRVVNAKTALAAGMVDRIETLDEAISRARSAQSGGRRRTHALKFRGAA